MDLSDDAHKAKLKLQAVSSRQFIIKLTLDCSGSTLPLFPVSWQQVDSSCLLFLTQQLSHHLFEELASDVYDEVDRRECDAGIAFKYFLWYIALHCFYTSLTWYDCTSSLILVTLGNHGLYWLFVYLLFPLNVNCFLCRKRKQPINFL